MTYAFIHDVRANDEIYGKVRSELGDEAPAGSRSLTSSSAGRTGCATWTCGAAKPTGNGSGWSGSTRW